jgi:hypothetical protein
MQLRRFSAPLLAIALPPLLFACNGPVVRGGETGEGGGGSAGSGGEPGRGSGAPGGTGGGFTLPEPPPPPSRAQMADARTCGLETFKLVREPTSLMLLLDRSSSMARPAVGGLAGATLWSETLAAMDEVVRGTQAGINWGLKLFPLPGGCLVSDGVEAPVAPNNHGQILGRSRAEGFNASGLNGTPTQDAVARAVAYLRSLPGGGSRQIVLATDGEPTCPAGPVETARLLAVQAVRDAATAGFQTYVIGIAIVPEAVDILNQMARAGGVPRADPALQFYPVANRTDLAQALNAITGQVANTSCIFTLSKPPLAPDSVKVTVDGERVPESASDGWRYTSNQNLAIQLTGSWCDRVKTRQQAQVDITLGCPGVVIP